MASLVQFNTSTDIVNDTQKIATSTWTNNTNNLTVMTTASAQAIFATPTSSGAFFIDVYNAHTSSTAAEVQLSLAYGHRKGSGSLNFTNDEGGKGKSASGVTYAQYRNLIFGDDTISDFSFDGHVPDDVFIININRARYKHNLKPGTLNLYLTGAFQAGTTAVNTNTGSGVGTNGEVLKLTDDSITSTGSAVLTNIGRRFNIVSGASGERSGSNLTQVADSGSYGHFYPDAGIIILNGDAISGSIGMAADRGDHVTPIGHQYLLGAMSESNDTEAYFIVDSEEKISSQYFFVRAVNDEFNYTTNPSFIDNQGNLNFASMIDNPRTYITTVGLYNNSGDLVAVAKLSQPVAKDFTKEAFIRVKLDY